MTTDDVGTEEASVRHGFRTSRRDLMITSVVLLLVQHTEIDFETINFLGNSAKIKDPSIIHYVLWLFWFYFFARYYEFFRDIPDTGIKSKYYGKVNALAKVVAGKRLKRTFIPPEEYREASFDVKINRIEPEKEPDEVVQMKIKVFASVVYRYPNGDIAATSPERTIELVRKDLLLPRVKAVFHVAVHTHLITEYALPFVIGILPILYFLAVWLNPLILAFFFL